MGIFLFGGGFIFLKFIYLFKLEDNDFTILWWFLPYISTNQPQAYICPLYPVPPSLFPPHPIPPGCHRALALGETPNGHLL